MFGIRPDGRTVSNMDPLVEFTSYIMPTRVDAQVFMDYDIQYDTLVNYIAKKSREGYKFTFMEIIIAAFVRGVAYHPEINRFIMNKRLYSRKELTVSFTIIRETKENGVTNETVVKVKFDPHDTIYDVVARIKKEVIENKKEEVSNITLKFAQVLMKVPFLPTTFVGIVRVLDKFGLLPKIIIDISPFHTSLFFTNMASIGMSKVFHHIYNFGTTSLFLSIGNVKRSLKLSNDGNIRRERLLPFGVTADERICAGVSYSQFFATLREYLKNPELLEQGPDFVKFDPNCEYSVPKPDPKYAKV